MFTTILAGNDRSPGGRKALVEAIDLAREISAELHMVTVEELPRFPASIYEIEEENYEADHRFAPVMDWAQAQAQAAGITIQLHLVPDHPVEAIVALVRENPFDLLVVGFIGHSALYERIIGGTADRLVRLAPCAVLVVK
jgi:nucleotide-binding universal stress UspA family protein